MAQSNDMVRVEIKIGGMTCAMCSGAIEKLCGNCRASSR